jgi:catechol 2,3-dioxygenase-like lactoylglutathione lyase family enzyme
MITGINHVTISVKDLDRAFRVYSETMGFKPLVKHDKGAYFLAGDLWFCLDLDPKTRDAELPEYTHLAFSVTQDDFQKVTERIRQSMLRIWKENKSEGDSMYFLDPDGHKLEIHVGSWETRLLSYRSSQKLSNATFFV